MKVRKVSLTTQILVINIIVLLVTTLTLSIVSMKKSEESIRTLINQRMLDIANSAAALADGDVLEKLTADNTESKEYMQELDKLAVFRDNTNLEYIYAIDQTGPESFVYTVDAAIDDPADFGEECETTDALIVASKGTADVDKEAYVDDWGKHYSAYSPVFNSQGEVAAMIGVDFSADWYDKQVADHIKVMVTISVLIFVLSVVVILVIIGRIKRGFGVLNNKICEIADGSGDLSKNIEVTSGDEFEVIANNMNVFIEQIRNIVSGVKNSVDGSVSASNELSVIAGQASDTMEKLREAIKEVSTGATQQASDVASASHSVLTISELLNEMNGTISDAEKCTGSMSDNSAHVSKSFDVLTNAIENSMKELGEVTDEIGKVGASVDVVIETAEVINEIASQTNLLSLNASIEAARAGESGRGFAVVADEIGKLAIQSNDSAASIKKIMDELKAQTGKAIDLVTELNKVMSAQVETSSESKEYLDTLFVDISNTKDSFGVIKNDAKSIQGACDELNMVIDSLSAISEENAASAELTAGSVTEINGIIGDVYDKSDGIKTLSGDLGEMVGSYRV